MAITQQKRNRLFCCWVYYRSNINIMPKKPKIRKISKGVADRNAKSAEVIRLIKLAKKKRK